MMLRLGSALLTIQLAACQLPGSAAADCDDVLRSYGAEHHVEAALGSTVGAIRSLQPLHASPPLWPLAREDDYATLCYIDGPMGKGPPPKAPIQDRYNRAAVGVWNGEIQVVALGYQVTMPLSRP